MKFCLGATNENPEHVSLAFRGGRAKTISKPGGSCWEVEGQLPSQEGWGRARMEGPWVGKRVGCVREGRAKKEERGAGGESGCGGRDTVLSSPDQGAATLWALAVFTDLTKSPQDLGLGKCSAE